MPVTATNYHVRNFSCTYIVDNVVYFSVVLFFFCDVKLEMKNSNCNSYPGKFTKQITNFWHARKNETG